MLDAARVTLGDHRTYNLSGFYFVCTSNIGSQQPLRPIRLPFTTVVRAVISELYGSFARSYWTLRRENFKALSPENSEKLEALQFPRNRAIK